MRRTSWALLLACSVGTVDAHAQLRVDSLAPKPADRISIFTVRGEGVTIPLVAFQEWSRQTIEAHMHAEIVPMDEMLARGGPTLMRRMVECRGEPRCFQQVIGGTVDTRYLLVVTATLLGETRLLGARLIDLSKLTIVGEAIDEVDGGKNFLDALPDRIRASVPTAQWDPFGGLRITVSEAGAQILVNDRIVGLSPIAPMPYLLPGQYVVVAQKAGFDPVTKAIDITRAQTVDVQLDLVSNVQPESSTWGWWVGAGAVVAGAAVLATVLVVDGGGEPTFCSAPSAELCL